MYLTISRDTIKEMGTKLVKSRIQLPHLIMSSFVVEIRTQADKMNAFLDIKTDMRAQKNVIDICMMKTTATMIPILNYNLDFFCLVLLELSMILESMPV